MSARAVMTIVAVSSVAVLAMAFAPAERGAMDEGMCAPPPVDTAKWKLMQTTGISMKVPPGFSQVHREENYIVFGSGPKQIAVFHGEGPDEVATRGALALTTLSTCTTIIGGRPVSIQVEKIGISTYLALARWRTINGLPTVTAWIYSNNRNDLHDLKGVFYTADVGVKPPKLCVDQTPLPAPDSVVDSAAIAVALAAKPAPWPVGNAVIQMKFDSAGSLGSIAVTAGDLPDSTKRAVAMVVGTNVREQTLHAPSTVQLRVTSTAAGVSYTVEKAVVCPQ